jgi:hypothetical protein
MQAYPSGDQFWVDHQEPHGDKNQYADNGQHASPTPHADETSTIPPAIPLAIHWRLNDQGYQLPR